MNSPFAGKKRNKYGAIKTMVDGVTFDSKAEAARYGVLKAMQRGSLISGLELQPRYDFALHGVKMGFYKADFRYHDNRTGETIVEDVKGKATTVYRLKKKMTKAFHGVDITEIQ